MDGNDIRIPAYGSTGAGDDSSLAEAAPGADQGQHAPLSPENGATRPEQAVEMARRLSDMVRDMVRQLDEQEAQGRQLRRQISALEENLRSYESMRDSVRHVKPDFLSEEDLTAIQRTLEALAQDPNHIMVLASVAQQAGKLLAVVDGYTRLQKALA